MGEKPSSSPASRRAGRGGTIINVSSGAGVFTLPLMSLCCASKFALEGFSESLPTNSPRGGVTVKLVEPGGVVRTNFGKRSSAEATGNAAPADHEPFATRVGEIFAGLRASRSATEEDVARVPQGVGRPHPRVRRLRRESPVSDGRQPEREPQGPPVPDGLRAPAAGEGLGTTDRKGFGDRTVLTEKDVLRQFGGEAPRVGFEPVSATVSTATLCESSTTPVGAESGAVQSTTQNLDVLAALVSILTPEQKAAFLALLTTQKPEA